MRRLEFRERAHHRLVVELVERRQRGGFRERAVLVRRRDRRERVAMAPHAPAEHGIEAARRLREPASEVLRLHDADVGERVVVGLAERRLSVAHEHDLGHCWTTWRKRTTCARDAPNGLTVSSKRYASSPSSRNEPM